MIMSTVKRRYSRQSARKVRSVLATIRNKQALLAYNQTLFINRKSAHDIAALIKSGMDACIKKNADENKLYISEARADQGPAMKRRWLHARGQSTQFKKEFCHIIISLTEKDDDSSRKITQIKKNRDQVRFPNNRMSVSTKVSAKGKE
ncbi:hypothetical protein COS66_01130 [Candidatus Berkelbacteria bacterium CG06_land_8_20_14_3_00_43_10]|uniref:50S ribosomal protein L22 n=1 Tax=Candidatus Berkelbacteria bacterium CG10_big_fil_rev_8_21_14_0_10_43_14 TaxID=1974515 RepID=A0A2M6RA40_9BACT|nr:MAG: hypothetical protein COT79_01995 [Candidatus Berkelbacteria bacterium CG10_big_fil_rev_8_21_14_0_10_43_14]PIU87409.1 MAG: hypothetical protein COS66_01130 [Candidatus Berkelbacteria bacterium CG06_land_8_20_14_3_00_43_10]